MIPRRTMLAAAPLALAGCGKADGDYFGKTDPPQTQRLVYLLGAEPGTLDPTKSDDLWEAPIIHALFEGLTSWNSITGEPCAAWATHYHASASGLRYTFWLRGHPDPQGVPFSGKGGKYVPARWSDGKTITAHDFVYSWRRAVDPDTAAYYAYQFHCITNAESISRGKASPEKLSVRALDDFTLEVQLQIPTPFFLRLTGDRQFFAVPRQSIEAAHRTGVEEAWTQPKQIVTSGAFRLRERRPWERIVLAKRRDYYGSGGVSLEEVVFVPVVDGPTSANLYRSGEGAFSMPMIPQTMAGLRQKKDVRTYANFGTHYNAFNTRRSPFRDARVRYAFNMAVDKRAIAAFFGDGRAQLKGLIPSLKGYPAASELRVTIGSASVDVLDYNPEAARRLLAEAGYGGGLSVEYLYPTMAEFGLVAEILQHQWRTNLGVDVRLVRQDQRSWSEASLNLTYKHIVAYGEIYAVEDPTSFLNMFGSATAASGTGWSNPEFDDLLTDAKATADFDERMQKLAGCEQFLLRAMPCMPLYNDVSVFLCKPFVKGLEGDPFHGRMFNDTWIDTNWRP